MTYTERGEVSRRADKPLITKLYNTGEGLNPWRCSSCLTKTQREQSKTAKLHHPRYPGPICCRKCGLPN